MPNQQPKQLTGMAMDRKGPDRKVPMNINTPMSLLDKLDEMALQETRGSRSELACRLLLEALEARREKPPAMVPQTPAA